MKTVKNMFHVFLQCQGLPFISIGKITVLHAANAGALHEYK